MPPKPTPTAPPTISAAVKAAAAIAAPSTSKQPPKKKKVVAKAKKPGSETMLQPIIKKPSALSVSTGTKSAGDNIKFTSQNNNNTPTANSILQKAHNLAASQQSGSGVSSSAIPTNNSSSSASQQQLEKFKLGRAKIARQELEQMDSIERAFREDTNVWAGPSNVVFPRRYHDGLKLNEDGTEKKLSGSSSSAIDNPYMAYYYGSQSQGWMYGEGYAGIGGQSWMEATSNNNNNNNSPDKKMKKKKKKNDKQNETNSNKAFLMDDVTIIDNALRANGLSRGDVTPKAYACLLEQSRRYALELITNAQDYAIHAQRHTIPSLLPSDLLLAVQMSNDMNGVSSTLPTPEEISNLSSSVNRTALPPIPSNCYNGVALPPVNEQLTARTYDVVNGSRITQRMMRGGDLPFVSDDLGDIITRGGDLSPKKKNKSGGSYGAGRGRQIVVNIKSGGGNVGGTAAVAGADGDASSATSGGNLTKVTTGVKKKGQKRTLTEL